MKVFVTVGSQLPFDRLIEAVDAWAQVHGQSCGGAHQIRAQVGDTTAPPRHFESSSELEPESFRAAVQSADLIVGHAGTGTIMAALCAGKPVVVLARREALLETRNDHQVATVKRFRELPGFSGTSNADEVPALIESALSALASAPRSDASATPQTTLRPHASGPIVERLRSFLDEALS